ncbi:MAG: hypothetical protein IJ002_05520 [Clostridia bacterium]|nr:hypothetical protein [Clostridia bacterium]
MKKYSRLIPSKDNSIDILSLIGRQKNGIIFWQKTGFMRHCNALGLQSFVTLAIKQFSPINARLEVNNYVLEFDDAGTKTIRIGLKQEPNSTNCALFGEAHTVGTDKEFHILVLEVIEFISKHMGCKFFVDDASGFLESGSEEQLSKYLDANRLERLPQFERINLGWNAEPNSPHLQVLMDGNNVVVEFVLYAIHKYKGFQESAKARITFKECVQYRVGAPNDEGFYVYGQSRFKKYEVQWGEFYQVHNSNWQNDFPDAVVTGIAGERTNHYLFYFKDETFECISSSYEIEII